MKSDKSQSFYWFDYETFGTVPAWDRPCQFAGVRTDMDLNVIGEPLIVYCRQSPDYLPQPEACRVTGITPQHANEYGVSEAEFIKRIIAEIGFPGTCSVGYNSIRFDDEFTRHTLFRNLLDPYEQEWKDGNTRWDLLDVVRLTRALRPKGIQWPLNEEGQPSNRLEHLSQINGIEHANAHDAMSDVWATIGMARLIRTAQPKLFEYAFAHRSKGSINEILNTRERKPCLQVSGMIPGSRHHLSAVLPLVRHPVNSNGVIVLDLHEDPRELAKLDVDELQRRLYQPSDSRLPDTPRPGLRTIQINKCPVLVPMATLQANDAIRLGIDTNVISQHSAWAGSMLDDTLLDRIAQAMTRNWDDDVDIDVEGTLYSGPFFTQTDKQRLKAINKATPDQLGDHSGYFDDKRLEELHWRYQARNFPETLSEDQLDEWREYCLRRLTQPWGPWLGFEEYDARIEAIDWTSEEGDLKQALIDYANELKINCRVARLRP